MPFLELFKRPKCSDGFALLAGFLLTLAFAPFDLFPLAMLAPALLVCSNLFATPKRAFYRGFLFGLAWFTSGIYWVFISIHTYGQADLFLSCFITVGLILFLSLYPALFSYFLNKYFPKNNAAKILFAFPALWVLFEWFRSCLFTGFPWLLLGYSQIHSPLKGFAPILGVYGVSFAVVMTSALVIYSVLRYNQEKIRLYYGYAIALWLIAGLLSLIQWTHNAGEPVKVSLIQGNIPQQVKWSSDAIEPTLRTYWNLTEAHWDSKIIVWPEAAIPMPLNYAEDFVNHVSDVAKEHGTTFITGIPIRANENGFYNAIITRGNGEGDYYKRLLVPFGEYVPYRNLLNHLLTSLQIPMSDMLPGPKIPNRITAGDTNISANICFEVAFPELSLNQDKDTNMLLTVSDDAWFNHSSAQAQHLEIAKMRALEMGRPLLFASNNGLTAIIGPSGKIQAAAKPFETTVLTAMVQGKAGLTPWQRYPMDPVCLLILGFLVWALRIRAV